MGRLLSGMVMVVQGGPVNEECIISCLFSSGLQVADPRAVLSIFVVWVATGALQNCS